MKPTKDTTDLRWFVLPRGYVPPDGDKLARCLVSVVACPLQTIVHDVAENPWLKDWPRTITTLQPALEIEMLTSRSSRGQSVTQTITAPFVWPQAEKKKSFARVYGAGDRSMWRDVFENTSKRARSFSEREVSFPRVPNLDGLGEYQAGFAQRIRLAEQRGSRAQRFTRHASEAILRENFEKLQHQTPSDAAKSAALSEWEEFNRVVGSISHYTQVAREVGLIIDGYFDLPYGHQAGSLVWMRLGITAPAKADAFLLELLADPPRHYFLRLALENNSTTNVFAAAVAPPGAMPELLTGATYFGAMTSRRLLHLDPGPAGAKLHALQSGGHTQICPFDPIALTLQGNHDPDAQKDTPATLGPEQLVVMNPGLVGMLQARAERADKMRQLPDPLVYAQDVARGFAVDLRSGDRWRSLCLREGRYQVLRSANAAWKSEARPDTKTLPPADKEWVPEESWVQFAVLGEKHFDKNYVSEVAFRLDGWSLVCGRPFGATESASDTSGRILDVKTRPQRNSVVPLRWGTTYQVRARFIDLAGYDMSSPFEPNEPMSDCLEFSYERTDPISAPVVGYAATPATAASKKESERSVVVGLVTPSSTKVPEVRRRVAAPPASFQVCEKSGAVRKDAVADAITAAKRDGVPAADANGVIPKAKPRHLVEPWAVGIEAKRTTETKFAVAKYLESWPDLYAKDLAVQPGPRRGADLERKLDDAELRGTRYDDEWPALIGAVVDATKMVERQATLLVTVPLADTVEIELRCAASEDAKQLVHHWDETGDEEAKIVALDSLTKSANVVAVCPVSFPLMNPRIVGAVKGKDIEIARQPQQTYSDWSVPAVVHAPSTGELALVSSWFEQSKTAPTPPTETPEELVSTHRVTRSAEHPDNTPPGVVKLELASRHHHADTRYRRVRYRLRGTTSFADYFSEAEVQQGAKESLSLVAHVMSSSPPEIPRVQMIMPFLRNHQQRRTGGADVWGLAGFRVYLGNEWYSSGEDEKLAIVMASEGQPLLQSVCWWGNDPIGSDRVPMNEAAFKVSAPHSAAIDFNIERGGEKGLAVKLLPVPVAFDAQRGWYADINVEVTHTERPFVQLALARYQARSIAGCKLSQIVRPDFVQLPAQRKVLVRRHDETLRVSIQRVAPSPFPNTNIACAVFDSTWKNSELPTETPDFDDPLRNAKAVGYRSNAHDPHADAQEFEFHDYVVQSGDRLVVWEQSRDDIPLPIRAMVVTLQR
jgi:hypothetical protein